MQLFISPLKPKQCQYSAVQCSAVPICKALQCLFLYKPGTDQCPAQHSLPYNLEIIWDPARNIGYFQSKLHPCHLVLCKWIQYLRNILPIYPIAPLSAICGFSESKSHFWVWETILSYIQCGELVHTASGTQQCVGWLNERDRGSRKHISICLFNTEAPLADLSDNIPDK